MITWRRHDVLHRAIEPGDVAAHAGALCDWYNLPENAALMGNTAVMTTADVLEYWAERPARRARGFLLFADDALVGDAELRNIVDGRGEFSLMIGALATQGRGFGGTFAAMVHVFAFRILGLERVYVQPLPENVRVQRLERRLGYSLDDSPEARAFADDDRAITMSIDRAAFEANNAEAWREVIAVATSPITPRPRPLDPAP